MPPSSQQKIFYLLQVKLSIEKWEEKSLKYPSQAQKYTFLLLYFQFAAKKTWSREEEGKIYSCLDTVYFYIPSALQFLTTSYTFLLPPPQNNYLKMHISSFYLLGLQKNWVRNLLWLKFSVEHEARGPHTVESLRSTLSGSLYAGVSRDFVDFGHWKNELLFISTSFTGLRGAKFICFQDRQWHSECFNCGKCSVSLVGEGFLTQNMEILCRKCGSGADTDM